MRVHSERTSNVDILSKILRRGSHAVDASTDDTSAGARKSITQLSDLLGATRGRKNSYQQQHNGCSNNNNQHRPSVSGGNSRFSALFIDPLYHAMTMGKTKDDGTRTSFSGTPSADATYALSADEVDRRDVLLALSFSDLHAAFDPFDGATPDDAMDNNELETLLEQEEENRLMLEAKAPASVRFASHGSSDSNSSDSDSAVVASHALLQHSLNGNDSDDDDDDDDDEELCFDARHRAASVRRLMHRISNVSVMVATSDADVLTQSNQDNDGDDDDDVGSSESDSLADTDATDRDDDAAVVIDDATSAELDALMVETTTPQTLVPSCFPQAEMPQDLSASVRRLVLGLQDDSDRRRVKPARRRGNSCPVPMRTVAALATPTLPLAPFDSSSSGADTSNSHALDSANAQRRKKTPFGRLAPRLLESLPLFRRKKKSFHYTDEELESIEGARWKIVELAFRFGGKHRFYLVQAVNMFFPLLKYGRRGGPHSTRLHCNHCGSLQWQHKRGARLSDSVDLALALQVLDGRQTAVFRKYPTSAALVACSFSIVFTDRTLDLETSSAGHRDWLLSALRTLISYAKTQRAAEQRAIAERSILPLDDAPLFGGVRSHDEADGGFGGATSPRSTNAMLLL